MTKGGVVTARPLDAAMVEQDGSQIDSDLVAREVQITLAQLPKRVSAMRFVAAIIGPSPVVEPLMESLAHLSERKRTDDPHARFPIWNHCWPSRKTQRRCCGLIPVAFSASTDVCWVTLGIRISSPQDITA